QSRAQLPERPASPAETKPADGASLPDSHESTGEPSTTIAPAADASPTAAGAQARCIDCDFWSRGPSITPMPRPGWFIIPPNCPDYYSLLDLILNRYRDAPPHFPYPPTSIIPFSYFDVDYRYLDDPNNEQHDWLDFTKRIHLGDHLMASFGGEFRFRFMDELDSRLTGVNNNYFLLRYRAYSDIWYNDRFRVFTEFLSADAYHESLPPLPIDRNLDEIQNLFVDVKLFEGDRGPIYARVGRQELLYGSQRLISPLDWANTRRTFQGAKIFYRSEKFDIDAFYTYPNNVSPSHYDAPNWNEKFAGLFPTSQPPQSRAS